ncbi:YesL family protein [Pseudalkalibacillus sp. R45]|uniref:YesL family protein n=1 Tax=Pseudalkalibacillus sp. R45 TaxID=3457433 RepID=UPI003FCE6DAB
MIQQKVLARINVLFEGVMLLCYLNILWLAFTIVGLGIFGFMPSTISMFHIVRKWRLGEKEFSIIKTFLKVYKQEFWKSQMLGLFYVVIGFLLVFNIQFFSEQNFMIVKYILVGLTFIYLLSFLFLFPIYVHYDMKLVTYIKSTIIMTSARLFYGIVMLIGIILIIGISLKFQALFFLLSGSLVAMWLTTGSLKWIVD